MDIVFEDAKLDRLETDAAFSAGFPPPVVSKFRQRMQMIRAADSEQDLRALKSLHFEKLKGKRAHQHSIRLNRQWRLVMEFRGEALEKW